MKIKKSIFLQLLFLSAFQLITAQKISLTYQVKSADSIYVLKDEAFSDKTMQSNIDKIFLEKIPGVNIVSVEDNVNRRFDKIKFKNTTCFARLISEGYFNFYYLKINEKPVYLIH